MKPQALDYAPRTELDVGRFAARYLQFLAWLSIATMISGALFFGRVNIDLSPIFLFWAASGLKRRSPVARRWVLVVGGLLLCGIGVALAVTIVRGTHGMRITFGTREIHNPAVWQVWAFSVLFACVIGVPFAVLMSERARRQFSPASAPRVTNEMSAADDDRFNIVDDE